MPKTNAFNIFQHDLEHSACGVVMRVDLVNSHELVLEALKGLAQVEYRSGYNQMTGESDGAGIRFFGLPVGFFQKKIEEGAFLGLEIKDFDASNFAIGQYFLPNDDLALINAKQLIHQALENHGLYVLGWRDLTPDLDTSILSTTVLQKKPAIFQAIIQSHDLKKESFESHVLRAGLEITHESRKQGLKINILSQSAESIVYKGMIKPSELGLFYKDLQQETFSTRAFINHARFATNTNPQWENAQPCVFFWAHNGELNSAHANALQMRDELDSNSVDFKGIYPDAKLSDSMQFDADMANQVAGQSISMLEAFTRLMPPNLKDVDCPNQQAMIQDFMLNRTPYNGPAFAVSGYQGYFVAKLDSVGLRPSRWALMQDSEGRPQFFAASDDVIEPVIGQKVITKGHLSPGGMLVFTPDGELLDTQKALQLIASHYPENYFSKKIASAICPLSEVVAIPTPDHQGAFLNRILYSAGWDYECVEHVVRYMAEHGVEKVGAMGDDTNPLYSHSMPGHIAYFFHQLFAQVSAPPLDSTHETENFSLITHLGAITGQKIALSSPMLEIGRLQSLEVQEHVPCYLIDTSFKANSGNVLQDLRSHLQVSLQLAAKAAKDGGILIFSDRAISADRLSIPDLIMVAAARRYLQSQKLIRQVSIVMDTYQVSGPHHASCLLALGANAVYPRGAYAKIADLFEADVLATKAQNYQHALNKCLLKTMGKMGITDVNNYINGHLVAALGLNLSVDEGLELIEKPSLANIFSGIYSPLKGIGLSHVCQALTLRCQQAFDLDNDFILMPYSGYFMPEKHGIKHGYGPVVINAFTAWLKTEEVHGVLARMHHILKAKGYPGFFDNELLFSVSHGFLNPLMKDLKGYYPKDYLEDFKASSAFKKMIKTLDEYRLEHPTCIRDYFKFKAKVFENPLHESLQSQQEIRALLFAGSMSQGALTVTDPKKPDRVGAHETLTRGMNAVGSNSASGEGGESYEDLRTPLHSTKSKQIASGRFGVNTAQIMHAQEMEIKIAQGAKPGEGGQLPGSKVSIRFAAQRGGLPGTPFVSPPPHHDIYSIEDLEQLIFDIKSVNQNVKVAVKLVASMGIGTIAVGVAKAGADVINIASHSGGTGAAQQSSIKHTGFPAELGLSEVDYALRLAKCRDMVQLRVSGGLKTADDVIVSAILGADLFELGTTAMLTLGCKMQRTCNQSCQPGVATDGHLFKGNQLNVERYFVNLAALIQERLGELGFASLKALRGRTDLIELNDENLLSAYDFSAILDRSQHLALLSAEEVLVLQDKRQSALLRIKEDQLIDDIKQFFKENSDGIYQSSLIALTTQDRSFGARIAGTFVQYLELNPKAKIILNTSGNAGQSFGFVMPKGMFMQHLGVVQDGCGKSMCGGELVLKTPAMHNNYHAEHNTLAGNVMLYGASSGKAFINGVAGHRFAILCKGAEIVVEGAGQFAFEYMTSGTGLVLGDYGSGLGASASGGIIIAYQPNSSGTPFSDALRQASLQESMPYESVIQRMLVEHHEKTGSKKASNILAAFDIKHFNVLIPKALDKIQSMDAVLAAIETFLRPEAHLSAGMRVWLEQKTLQLLQQGNVSTPVLNQFAELLSHQASKLFSSAIHEQLMQMLKGHEKSEAPIVDIEDLVKRVPKTKKLTDVSQRLSSISGQLDEVFFNAIAHIQSYISELAVDAQGCSGCRAQSCAGGDGVDSGCPSGKQINTINAILQRLGTIKDGILTKTQWQILREAFELQIKESPFIAYTGAACPAPCEDACTESIPNQGGMKGSKAIGEPVHIKDIEYHLYHLGRALGWFTGQMQYSQEQQLTLFGQRNHAYQHYLALMKTFKPAFLPPEKKVSGKKLLIVGSGPAAMQVAFEALRDGFVVEMYERSDKPGGLLFDGIPAHKFDKSFIIEDFHHLQMMGLNLFLNHEVCYDDQKQGFYANDRCIAHANDERTHVVLCLGAGKPVSLAPEIMPASHQDKIIQAVDLLKAKNDIASALSQDPKLDKETLIAEKLGKMDTRGKKVVVIGGGDTAQDVIRWVARYFNDEKEQSLGELNILVRGLPSSQRAILDAYPAVSRAPTKENGLKEMEVDFVAGDTHHRVYPTKIEVDEQSGQLSVHLAEVNYRYQREIESSRDLAILDALVPREMKPKDQPKLQAPIENVDMVILALGFQGRSSMTLANQVEEAGLTNVSFAGDAAQTKAKIIVGAQASAHETYQNRIKPILGIAKVQVKHSIFAASPKISCAGQSAMPSTHSRL